ncbi:MAG: fibronectin type III domain-containing protein, partial [Cetobacterium sp.]
RGLSWEYQTTPSVDGFRLFWSVGTEWNGPIELGKAREATLPGLLRGATYRFYIVAYNEAGVSQQSNVAILEIP